MITLFFDNNKFEILTIKKNYNNYLQYVNKITSTN